MKVEAFARLACDRHGIPQPGFTVCDSLETAAVAIAALGGACVIKADGLAAGKGVVVADSEDEAVQERLVKCWMAEFGDAGRTLLVEEQVTGQKPHCSRLLMENMLLFSQEARRITNVPMTGMRDPIPAVWAPFPQRRA